jgi:peptidoglycan/xylan/chitin deacetylase (PgdA/CDA1 family)
MIAPYREISRARRDEFVRRGHKERHFFPHRLYHLPKCGPDGYRLAHAMCGERDPNRLWELVLYAAEEVLAEFPRELFFDDEVIWHRQQFGRPGQVATVNVVLRGADLYTSAHLSDLVQRIPRRREHKTRIEKVLDGWDRMLLNGILSFALEHRVKRVHTPTAALAIRNTDRARTPGPELFERIYDRNVTALFPAKRRGDWWTIDVSDVRGRVVVPERGDEPLESARSVCLSHDIERGFGHWDADAAHAAYADASGTESLAAMLAIEDELGWKATYNVLGVLMDEVREPIEAGGHCLGFHSYDHEIQAEPPATDRHRRLHRWRGRRVALPPASGQLNRCREVDYRIKGYRPPRSLLNRELTDANLCFHNFEWLASSPASLGTATPRLVNRLAKIPVQVDDWALYCGVPYDEWEEQAIRTLREHELASICLHDCYASFWLPHYRGLLRRLEELGLPRTMDEIAADVAFAAAS